VAQIGPTASTCLLFGMSPSHAHEGKSYIPTEGCFPLALLHHRACSMNADLPSVSGRPPGSAVALPGWQ
jgi:hypothetical protein